jgi:alpha-ketoglutarate-dependent taurine dioxygenase
MKEYIGKIAFNDSQDISSELINLLKEYKVIHCVSKSKNINLDYYEKLARNIGKLALMEEDLTTGNKNGNLFTDIKWPVSFTSSSYSHSNTRQPLHTDGSYESNSPNITFFACLKKSKYGGATVFIENIFLIEILKFYDDNLLQDLKNNTVDFSKGNDFKKEFIIDNNNLLNWNYHRCEKNELTNRFHDFLEEKIIKSGLVDSVLLNEGDAVFFRDNMVLHGRNSFIGERWLIKGGIHERS